MALARRRLLPALALPVLAASGTGRASEHWRPVRPIVLHVPFAPGAGADLVGRVVARSLARELAAQVAVANLPGGDGTRGSAAVARMPPDGHGLLLGSNVTHAVAPAIIDDPGYDPLRDFTPLAGLGSPTFILVAGASVPVGNLGAFVDWARAQPRGITFATSNAISIVGLALLARRIGITAHRRAFDDTASAVASLAMGEVDVMMLDIASVAAALRQGRVRALATTTSGRAPMMPYLPTLHESGFPGFDTSAWLGVLAPAGLPEEVAATLSAALQRAARQPNVAVELAGLGVQVDPVGGESLAARMRAELPFWQGVAREAGLRS
jgi:tripartite-type tricarboxylate transporter receptor subunit TctC